MTELMKITRTAKGTNVVDARELHTVLESGQKFGDWITTKVVNNSIFVENDDYVLLHNVAKQTGRGGHNRKDYAITLNTAKQVALMENTQKGREIRQYFIDVENKQITSNFMLPRTLAQALRLAADQAEVVEKQQLQLEAQKPKVLFSDAVVTSGQSCLVGELAKILSQNGINIGQNRLFEWLRAQKYLGSNGERYNQPLQKSMDMRLFEIKKNVVIKPDGSTLVVSTTKVTPMGQIFFINKFAAKWQK